MAFILLEERVTGFSHDFVDLLHEELCSLYLEIPVKQCETIEKSVVLQKKQKQF